MPSLYTIRRRPPLLSTRRAATVTSSFKKSPYVLWHLGLCLLTVHLCPVPLECLAVVSVGIWEYGDIPQQAS